MTRLSRLMSGAALLALAGGLGACTTVESWFGGGHSDGHAGHGGMHAASAEMPLLEGLGTHTHKVSASPEAQAYFDQGLRLAFNFNHAEAIRSFERGAALDPNCAMCWWGASWAHGPNINMPMDPAANAPALAALAKAQALAPNVTPVEQAYIAALAKRYSETGDRAALDKAFAAAMGDVARAHPDDLDAQTIYAEALMDTSPWNYWQRDMKTAQPGLEALQPTLEGVLARDPNHMGAIHLYIHAMELPYPKKAEPYADKLAAMAPMAGHLVHMPAHIYYRVGRYFDAADTNVAAAKADETYFARSGSKGMYGAMYYVHNLHYVWSTAAMYGQSALADDYGRRVAAAIDPAAARAVPMIEGFVPVPTLTLVRFGKWDQVLTQPAPDAELQFATALTHYARARAYAAKNDLANARAERDKLAALSSEALYARHHAQNFPALPVLQVAERIVAGDIARAEGDKSGAIRAYREAVKLEDGIPYMEPPFWDYPTRHTLGAALLDAGRARDAEKVYRADLKNWPENGWALFGLAQALEAQGKTREAAKVRERQQAAWSRADVQLASTRF